MYGITAKTCCKQIQNINPNYYDFRKHPSKGTNFEYNRKVVSGPVRDNEFNWGIVYQDKTQHDRKYRPTLRALHNLPCSRDPSVLEKNLFPTRHWKRK